MASINELITKYTLQDNFSQKADHIRAKAKNAADAIQHGQRVSKISWGSSVGGSSTGMSFGGGGGGMFGDMFSGMADAASNINPISLAIKSVIGPLKFFISTYLDVFQKLSVVTATGVGLLGAFVGKALQAANEFDSMERSFSAMLGSVDKGKQMMLWIRQYGLSSGFTQDAIVETTRSVVALGLDVEKYLPILEKFALFAGPDPSNLTEMAAIMRRLVGGQIAEAFGPEGLGRFGINRQMLSSFGAQFNKQGQFIGGVTEALLVLERVANESPMLKGLKAAFDDSPAVKFSNAVDAIQIALIEAGKVFQVAFMPYVEKFSEWIKQMVGSGGVQRFATNIVNMFSTLINKAGGFEGILNTIASGLEQLPNVLSGIALVVMGMGKVIFGVVKGITDFAVDNIKAFIMAYNASFARIFGEIEMYFGSDDNLREGINKLTDAYRAFFSGPHEMSAFAGANVSALNDSSYSGGIGARVWKNAEEFGADGMNGGLLNAPKGQGSNPIETELSKVAENTKQTAINTSYLNPQRFALGGGDLGRSGLEYSESKRINRTPTIKITGGGTEFGRLIQEHIVDALKQLSQQGYELKRTRA